MPNWMMVLITCAGFAIVLYRWLRVRMRREQPFDLRLERQLRDQVKILMQSGNWNLSRALNDSQRIALRNFIVHYPPPCDLEGEAREAALKLLRIELEIRGAVETPDFFWVAKKGKTRRKPVGSRILKLWDVLGLLFSRKMREQVYDPVIGELKEDLLLSRSLRRTPAARNWIQACFFVRTAVVFLQCVTIAFSRPLSKLLPAALKAWWRLFT